MTFPSPALRADWWASNNEGAHAADQLYGHGHRPDVEQIGAAWVPACRCPNPNCTRADDNSRRTHHTWGAAWHAAVRNLTDSEHGPNAGQEPA
jgi:hypothetical protein